MEIKYDLLPKQKTQKHNLGVEIDLYPYATELYEELDKIGIIERIKEIPQLGVIKVKKKLAKTRFDYVMLQLYLHKLIKNRLQGDLRYTYNNYINSKEFREDYENKNFRRILKNENKYKYEKINIKCNIISNGVSATSNNTTNIYN